MFTNDKKHVSHQIAAAITMTKQRELIKARMSK